MHAEQTVATREQMQGLGRRLAGVLQRGDLVVLTGDLGAGKTTLTQGIGAGLGVRGGVTSPTFVIARVHPSQADGPPLVHVDAYRLGSIAEVDDLDLDAVLHESVTVVEWGDGLVDDLSTDRLHVSISRPHGQAHGPDLGPDGDRGLRREDVETPAEVDEETGDLDQPRRVRIEGHGPRWAEVRLAG